MWKGSRIGNCYAFPLILQLVILFYNIFRILYFGGIRIASNWNNKARLWVSGRKNWRNSLKEQFQPGNNDRMIWMHCASLGEFEQGRPIIEKLKQQFPSSKIVLTFFSPSGYVIRKDYQGADVVMYLPPDSRKNAIDFLDLVQPTLAIFVKYEFWHYYLSELRKRKIETILVSGIFRNSQPFFQWWGGFYKNMLLQFTHLFVQNESSAKLLASINIQKNVTVCGDTRFDRVIEAAEQWKPIAAIDSFIKPHKKLLVAGSTWKEDEELISQWFLTHKDEWQLIIAPHEIDEAHIQEVQQLFKSPILFSQLISLQTQQQQNDCLLINSIGHLSRLYNYASVCYVGGGFNKSGHHNILEAAVYGKAVITGPVFQKFKESVDLKKSGGSFQVNNITELADLIEKSDFVKAGTIAKEYVQQQAGATTAIMNYIQEKRLFTNA